MARYRAAELADTSPPVVPSTQFNMGRLDSPAAELAINSPDAEIAVQSVPVPDIAGPSTTPTTPTVPMTSPYGGTFVGGPSGSGVVGIPTPNAVAPGEETLTPRERVARRSARGESVNTFSMYAEGEQPSGGPSYGGVPGWYVPGSQEAKHAGFGNK